MGTITRIIFLALCFVLSACSGGGGGGGSASTPAPSGAVASALSFPLQTGWKALIANGYTNTFTISQDCSGTATLIQTRPSAATFEGVAGLASVLTTTLAYTNCTPASAVQTETDYYDTNYVTRGFSVSGANYGIFRAAPIIPTTVKVGDTATLGTEDVYTNSSKTAGAGTRVISYVIEPDTASTAVLNITARDYDIGANLISTEQDRYTMDQFGALTYKSIDLQFATPSTLHLIFTRN
jgi:hypothetical protein